MLINVSEGTRLPVTPAPIENGSVTSSLAGLVDRTRSLYEVPGVVVAGIIPFRAGIKKSFFVTRTVEFVKSPDELESSRIN